MRDVHAGVAALTAPAVMSLFATVPAAGDHDVHAVRAYCAQWVDHGLAVVVGYAFVDGPATPVHTTVTCEVRVTHVVRSTQTLPGRVSATATQGYVGGLGEPETACTYASALFLDGYESTYFDGCADTGALPSQPPLPQPFSPSPTPGAGS